MGKGKAYRGKSEIKIKRCREGREKKRTKKRNKSVIQKILKVLLPILLEPLSSIGSIATLTLSVWASC